MFPMAYLLLHETEEMLQARGTGSFLGRAGGTPMQRWIAVLAGWLARASKQEWRLRKGIGNHAG